MQGERKERKRIMAVLEKTLEKSKSWDVIFEKRKRLAPSQCLPGFPFNEGFPKDREAQCDIILNDGTLHKATLNLETQYRAEGIQWKDSTSETWPKTLVAAWRVCP